MKRVVYDCDSCGDKNVESSISISIRSILLDQTSSDTATLDFCIPCVAKFIREYLDNMKPADFDLWCQTHLKKVDKEKKHD